MNQTELETQVRALLAQGRKVQAVKRVVQATGWELKKSKDYVDGLARLARDYSALLPDELLTALEEAGRTPELDLIRACLERREALTPGLLTMLSEGSSPDWDTDDPRNYRDVHAGLLLCAFREPGALPIFGKLFRDETQNNILEWFDQDLPTAYGPAATAMLLDLINETDAYDYPRTSAMEMLTIIAQNHPEERERIVAALRALLPPLADDGTLPPDTEYAELWTWVAYSLSDLGDHASQPHVLALYQANAIDEWIMGDKQTYLTHFGPSRHEPQPFDILKTYQWLHDDQAAQEAQREAAASQRAAQAERATERKQPTAYTAPQASRHSQPKVGRNAPCPCGSGKKFKHCCGKRH